MGGLEITLIVIGLLIIGVSYLVSEKVAGTTTEVKQFETVEDYERRKELEENVKNRFERLAEEAVDKVDASLCKLSNEKIMAVNEYGDMVLDRIDKNHQEVVFLYSMLTDKEKELKQFVTAPTPVKLEEKTKETDQERTAAYQDSFVEEPVVSLSRSQAKGLKIASSEEAEEEKSYEQQEQILSLLEAGKSILDISKELGLGQGEVQLVANLHAGGRKG